MSSGSPVPLQDRLVSLDAYRGLAMFLIMSELFQIERVGRAFPDSSFWRFLTFHTTHAEWVGSSLYDLVQPVFCFAVGVALPLSIAGRLGRGHTLAAMTAHALRRSVVLILIGVFLRSIDKPRTLFAFDNVMSQIGLGYFFLFVLGLRPRREQWIAFAALLFGYWLAFVLYPSPGPYFRYYAVGVPGAWTHHATGLAAHWNKNSNLAWAFDTWFLNLWPRERPFVFEHGGYATLNFVPTLATMILGLLAGEVLRSDKREMARVRWLSLAGVIGVVAGLILNAMGLCPLVKRLWTPSWTVYSGGWCLLLLAAAYLVIDVRGWRAWTFPFVVMGMNSGASYFLSYTIDDFTLATLKTHLGRNCFKLFGEPFEPLFGGVAVAFVLWLILFWMYRRRLFLRV